MQTEGVQNCSQNSNIQTVKMDFQSVRDVMGNPESNSNFQQGAPRVTLSKS